MPIQSTTTAFSWAPSAANSVTVTPSGVAWGNSAWVQLLASAPAASVLFALEIDAVDGGGSTIYAEVEIGVGAAGSEVPIAVFPFGNQTHGVFWNTGATYLTIGMDGIPSGKRVAVRLRQSTTTVVPWGCAVGYFQKPIAGGPVLTTINAITVTPAATAPLSLPPAGNPSAAWTNGVWTTVLANPATDMVVLGYLLDWMNNGAQYEIDLATGPSGAEVVTHTTKAHNESIPGGPEFVECRNPLDFIRATVRVAARQRSAAANNINTTAIKLQVAAKPL